MEGSVRFKVMFKFGVIILCIWVLLLLVDVICRKKMVYVNRGKSNV